MLTSNSHSGYSANDITNPVVDGRIARTDASDSTASADDIVRKSTSEGHPEDSSTTTTSGSDTGVEKNDDGMPSFHSNHSTDAAAETSTAAVSQLVASQPTMTLQASKPLGISYSTTDIDAPNKADANSRGQPGGKMLSVEEGAIPQDQFQSDGFMTHMEENNLNNVFSNLGLHSGKTHGVLGISALDIQGGGNSNSNEVPSKPHDTNNKTNVSNVSLVPEHPVHADRDTSTILIPATQSPTSYDGRTSFGLNPTLSLGVVSSVSSDSPSSTPSDPASDYPHLSNDPVASKGSNSNSAHSLAQDSVLFPSGDYSLRPGMHNNRDRSPSPFTPITGAVERHGSQTSLPVSSDPVASLAPSSAGSHNSYNSNSDSHASSKASDTTGNNNNDDDKASDNASSRRRNSHSRNNRSSGNNANNDSSDGKDNKDKDDKPDYTLDIEAIRNGTEKRTTLMIRNIPNKYTQLQFINELFNSGFRGKFDFLYLPIDVHNTCNIGYAFINMKSPDEVLEFYEAWHGNSWPLFRSRKRCEITLARIQGQAALTTRFLNSPILVNFPLDAQPLIFHTEGPLIGQGQPLKYVIEAKSQEIMVNDPTMRHPDNTKGIGGDVIGHRKKGSANRRSSVSGVSIDADDPRHVHARPNMHPAVMNGMQGPSSMMHNAGPAHYDNPDASPYNKHMMGGPGGKQHPDAAGYPPHYRGGPGHPSYPPHWRYAPYPPYYGPPPVHDPHYDYYYPPADARPAHPYPPPHMHPPYPAGGHRPHPIHPGHRGGYDGYPGSAPPYGHPVPLYDPYAPPSHAPLRGKGYPGGDEVPPAMSKFPPGPGGSISQVPSKSAPNSSPYYPPRAYPDNSYDDYPPGFYNRGPNVDSSAPGNHYGSGNGGYDTPGTMGQQQPSHGQYASHGGSGQGLPPGTSGHESRSYPPLTHT